MTLRKTLLAGGMAAALGVSGLAGAATLHTQANLPASVTFTPLAIPNSTSATVLYDQTVDLSTSGLPVQFFGDSYDAEGADDFVVPSGGWDVTSVAAVFFGPNIPGAITTTSAVNFYADAGGLPGAAACSYPAAPTTLDPAGFTMITLPSTCSLTAGTYWVGIMPDVDYATYGQSYWLMTNSQTNSMAAWRNPGGGFGTCPSWGSIASCLSSTLPDFAFAIIGEEGATGGGGTTPPGGTPGTGPAGVPTLGQWGAGLGIGLLALLGLFGLRRREMEG